VEESGREEEPSVIIIVFPEPSLVPGLSLLNSYGPGK
jgi:hypothetical protein